MFDTRVIMGGIPRSGSSLIRSILNGHPAILAPRETAIFIQDFAVLRQKSNKYFERLSERTELPLEDVRKLCSDARSSIAYFDSLMLQWAQSIGAEQAHVWLEKTPRNCLRYNAIASECPDVKFISTVRDGRDVCTSIFQGRSDYYCSVERYVEAVDAIFAFDSPNHMVVKYEDFVAARDEKLREILSFIGVEWDDRMIESYLDAPGRSLSAKIAKPVVANYVERWRDPEHSEKIDEFYSSDDALRCLQLSGYEAVR